MTSKANQKSVNVCVTFSGVWYLQPYYNNEAPFVFSGKNLQDLQTVPATNADSYS